MEFVGELFMDRFEHKLIFYVIQNEMRKSFESLTYYQIDLRRNKIDQRSQRVIKR